MNDIKQYISVLDSERFGFKIAKLPYFIDDIECVISDLKVIDVKMIIIRLDATKTGEINYLESLGFQLKDVQLIYNYKLEKINISNNLLPREFNVRDYKLSDISQILDITKESFFNYGHYFNDKRLDAEKCLEVYIDWAKNCCYDKGVADNIIVAEKNNEIAGFLAFKHNKQNESTFACLGAVNSRFRNQGVFNIINSYGLNWAKSLGMKNVITNVLNTNFAVNNTYINLGFKIVKSEITMHYWL